jgi:hypothetical protein
MLPLLLLLLLVTVVKQQELYIQHEQRLQQIFQLPPAEPMQTVC